MVEYRHSWPIYENWQKKNRERERGRLRTWHFMPFFCLNQWQLIFIGRTGLHGKFLPGHVTIMAINHVSNCDCFGLMDRVRARCTSGSLALPLANSTSNVHRHYCTLPITKNLRTPVLPVAFYIFSDRGLNRNPRFDRKYIFTNELYLTRRDGRLCRGWSFRQEDVHKIQRNFHKMAANSENSTDFEPMKLNI